MAARSINSFRTILPLCLAGFLVCAVGTGNADDDGWRRTVDGWERLEDLHAAANANSAPQQYHFAPPSEEPSRPRDMHPLALAVMQLSVVLVSYCLFPASLKGRADSLKPNRAGVRSAAAGL